MENEVVCYIIVRDSLHLNPSQLASQVAHSITTLMLSYFKLQIISTHKATQPIINNSIENHIKLTNKWISTHSRNVVKKANDKEFEEIKAEFARDCFVTSDDALTKSGSGVIITLWPCIESEISQSISKLSLFE